MDYISDQMQMMLKGDGISLPIVGGLVLVCLVIIFAIVYFRNPFSYPYMTFRCDITGQRNPNREDEIDKILCDPEKIREINDHQKYIRDWKAWCRRRIEKSPFKAHRRRQYEKKLPDKNETFRFEMYRNTRKYGYSDGHRYSYKRKQTEAVCVAGIGELKRRYRELRKNGFQDTLNGSEKKKQRKLMTPALRKQIAERDNYTCCICGKYMPDMKGLTIDHIIPVSKGGKTVPENLQVLCSSCNSKKSDKV